MNLCSWCHENEADYGSLDVIGDPICGECLIAETALQDAKRAEIAQEARVLARSTDASTSHAAAEAMAGSETQRGLKALVLKALSERDGMTSGEISDAVGEEHQRIWRRVSDAKNEGLIVAKGERQWHGRAQQVWWLARG